MHIASRVYCTQVKGAKQLDARRIHLKATLMLNPTVYGEYFNEDTILRLAGMELMLNTYT